MRTRSTALGLRVAACSLWLAGATCGVGCGGSQPAAKQPTEPAASASAAASAPPSAAAKPGVTGAAAAAYNQGMAAYLNGDLAAARQAFERAVADDPGAYQAHYALGVVLERRGDSGASAAYRRAFTAKADFEPAIAAYGLYLAKRGNLSEAETFLQQKRGSMPNSAAVIAALAEVKSLQRDTASAQQLAQEALKKNSDYRPAMVVIARDHYRNRRLDLALYALQSILDGFGDINPPRDKDNAEAHYLRALILKEEDRRTASLKELREAVRIRPDLVAARLELASAALESGNAAEALPQLEAVLRYDPDNVTAHLNLADCYRLSGRVAEAKKEFEWVIQKDSSLAQPHYDLTLLYLFAPAVSGMSPKQQADQAVVEITKYQQMRGRMPAGQTDDSDELLNRARQKQAEVQAQSSAKEPVAAPSAPASPPPAASATPAAVRPAASATPAAVRPAGAQPGATPGQPR